MENKKGKKKQKISLVLLLLVLCCGVVAGVFLLNQKENVQVSNEDTDIKEPVKNTEVTKTTSSKYTVIVKDETGLVLPNVLVSICDAQGNMITEPEATDSVGRLMYTSEEEADYGACVIAAPYQYYLDKQVYYFESGKKLLNIVLQEDPDAYVAKIGDKSYTLSGAISAASSSMEDVTITLLHDIYLARTMTLKNKNGKTITFDGNGKTITYLANSTMFSITQADGTVNFKNMTIVHNGSGAAFRTTKSVNLNLTDVTLLAKNDTEGFYKWSLFNLFGAGKTNLTMTRVKVDMDISTVENDAAASAAVIRTGNAGTEKEIKITMNDCYIDATDAYSRIGIMVTEDTTANVVFNNSTFLTQNKYVIAIDGQLDWSQTNSTLGSKDEYYNEHPIPDVVATVGSLKFYNLSTAAKKASALGGKEVVKLIGDITLSSSTSFSGKGISAIIDGNGHTITTEGSSVIFKINSNDYKLTFRNMTINHGAYDRLLQYEAKKTNIDVTWENVKVVASGIGEKNCYSYGLINLRGSGVFNMNSSTITLDVPKILKGAQPGVIRTGNPDDGQTLKINLTDSTIDASATTGAYGIYVQKGAKTDIVLKNYEIHTNNTYPIYVHADDGDATLAFDTMHTWTSQSSSIAWLCNLISMLNLGDAAKIGDTAYATLTEAISVAKESGEDVTIELLRDCYLSERTNFETADSSITIDGGDKYSLTTKGGVLLFVLNEDNIQLTFKDLVINHEGYERFITFNKKEEGDFVGQSVVFDNVEMIASGSTEDSCYQYGLMNLRSSGSFTMIDSSITTTVEQIIGGNNHGVIRLGNDKDGQTVSITMTNSTIDASATEGQAVIYIPNGNKAEVSLTNATLKTNNQYPIYMENTATMELTEEQVTWSCEDETIKAMVNSVANVGNAYYGGFVGAWNAVKNCGEEATITLLADCSLTEAISTATEGTKITIDGGEHTKYTLTVKPADDTSAIALKANDVDLTLKNLVIDHQGNERLITEDSGKTGIDITLQNTKITASGETEKVCYRYGIFNLRSSGSFTMTGNSSITTTVASVKGGDNHGVIRLGNDKDAQTVAITIDESSIIDSSATAGLATIYIPNGNTAEVTLSSATLKTDNQYPIYLEDTATLKLTEENVTWTCEDSTVTSLVYSGATVKGIYYGGMAGAWNAAIASDDAVTITMLHDCTVTEKLTEITDSGTNITIDGQNLYTLTTAIDNTNDNVINLKMNKNEGKMNLTFQNMDIVHTTPRPLVAVGYNKSLDSSVQIQVNNVDIDVHYTNEDYKLMYGLFLLRNNSTLFMTDVDVKVETTGSGTDNGIIRVGNNDDEITAYARLQNCTLDTTAANNVSIARINNKNTLDIACQGCTLKTKNVYVFNKTSTGILNATVDTYTNTNSEAGTKTQLNSGPTCTEVDNIATAGASINGFLYANLAKAWTDAQLFDGYVTVKMLKDSSLAASASCDMTTANVDITLEGQGKTLTTGATTNSVNALYIKNDNIVLTLQNIKVKHLSKRAFINVCNASTARTGVKVTLQNAELSASQSGSSTVNEYGVINIRNNAELYMKNVVINYSGKATSLDGNKYNIIHFGNGSSSDGGARTMSVMMENCKATITDGVAPVFYIPSGHTVTIEAKGCNFTTYKAPLVCRTQSNNLTLKWWNTSTWTDSQGTYTNWVNQTDCASGYVCKKEEETE